MQFISTTWIQAGNWLEVLEIERTVKNYLKAWYHGDAEKLEEFLHTDLAKRSVQPRSDLRKIYASDMISWTIGEYGMALWEKYGYSSNRCGFLQ